jgi:hypothetical protein
MTTLAHYQTAKASETNAFTTISAKLDEVDLRMDDFALMVKAIELFEDVQDTAAYDALLEKVMSKAQGFYDTSLSGEDVLMLTRATRLGNIPFGGEDRWLLLNRDDRNLDFEGDVIVGERSFEAFGDRIFETY